jgi:hypothetical protein
MKENRHARSPPRQVEAIRPTTACETVAQFACNVAVIQHWRMIAARHMHARSRWGGIREERHRNRAPQCCRQTPQHHALLTDASAMTERESYSAIAGLALFMERSIG